MNQQIYLFIWFIFNFWIGCSFFSSFREVDVNFFFRFCFSWNIQAKISDFVHLAEKKTRNIAFHENCERVFVPSIAFLFSIRRKVIYGVNKNKWYHRKNKSTSQTFSMIQLNSRYGFCVVHWKKSQIPCRSVELCYKCSI